MLHRRRGNPTCAFPCAAPAQGAPPCGFVPARGGRSLRSVLRAFGPALLLGSAGTPLAAQTTWNDPRTLAVVRTAIDHRAEQLADTGLVEYQATAHGYLTFLVQLGRGFPTPPKIARTDQLALQVYWRSPDQSKQRIIGRRDTTLLPTDILYHRDHLGIVQNNFPNIIRLGEGDEVRDVPHPLSPGGMARYDYAIADSLRIAIPGQTFDVYEVKVRPKDSTQPAVVGALYLDRHSGQVVRMAFSFTRAALLDPALEDISIVLENGLIGTKYWLPRHQEIEIRRTGNWFDYPVRGIIRGRWEVSDYKINEPIPAATFTGPQYDQASPPVLNRYPWHGNILDSLPPDVSVTTDADVRRVQAEARALVREQALRRAEQTRLSARGLSDFASVNRVQGLALGFGVEEHVAGGVSAAVRPQYGIDDATLRGGVSLDWTSATGTTLSLYGRHTLADVRDEPERSRVVNSLAAQEFGSDATEPYDLRAVGANLSLPAAGLRWTVDVAREAHRPVAVHARPALGAFAPTIDAARYAPLHFQVDVAREAPAGLGALQATARLRFDQWHATRAPACPPGGAGCTLPPRDAQRGSLVADVTAAVGSWTFASHTDAAVAHGAGAAAAPQQLVYFGGPVTAPGYPLHGLVGSRGISQRFEARLGVPFYAFSLGGFGRAPARATLAPYFNLAALDPVPGIPALPGSGASQRVFPSAGIGFVGFFDLLRLDVARGLRGGGRWTFSIDVAREFWSIL